MIYFWKKREIHSLEKWKCLKTPKLEWKKTKKVEVALQKIGLSKWSIWKKRIKKHCTELTNQFVKLRLIRFPHHAHWQTWVNLPYIRRFIFEKTEFDTSGLVFLRNIKFVLTTYVFQGAWHHRAGQMRSSGLHVRVLRQDGKRHTFKIELPGATVSGCEIGVRRAPICYNVFHLTGDWLAETDVSLVGGFSNWFYDFHFG